MSRSQLSEWGEMGCPEHLEREQHMQRPCGRGTGKVCGNERIGCAVSMLTFLSLY